MLCTYMYLWSNKTFFIVIVIVVKLDGVGPSQVLSIILVYVWSRFLLFPPPPPSSAPLLIIISILPAGRVSPLLSAILAVLYELSS